MNVPPISMPMRYMTINRSPMRRDAMAPSHAACPRPETTLISLRAHPSHRRRRIGHRTQLRRTRGYPLPSSSTRDLNRRDSKRGRYESPRRHRLLDPRRRPRSFTRRIPTAGACVSRCIKKFTTGPADKFPVATRTAPVLMMFEIQREAGFRDFDGAKF